jgi:hypothetical protein
MHIVNSLKDMALCLMLMLHQAMHSKQVDTLPMNTTPVNVSLLYPGSLESCVANAVPMCHKQLQQPARPILSDDATLGFCDDVPHAVVQEKV